MKLLCSYYQIMNRILIMYMFGVKSCFSQIFDTFKYKLKTRNFLIYTLEIKIRILSTFPFAKLVKV